MTKRISTRGTAVAEKIRDREPFLTHGAFRGESVDGLTTWNSGRLPAGEDLDRFRVDCTSIRYVVYSYATPIAWWTPEAGWYKVKAKFSPTTTRHQGRLYLIEDGGDRA